ncbi:MAG: DUF2400 domain-containing protein, partial [Chitinophagia bacterium]|nr:DUF2400 domain-containing protein [Chitinophagia bacterium]
MIDPALEQHILRLKPFLDAKAHQFHSREFIGEDPVSIPHRFSLRQDIEIAAFLTAILSWGRRPLILKSALRLMEILDNSPYQFITQCKAKDIKKIDHFVHRTFNTEDLHNFLLMLKKHYRTSPTLETAFCIPKQYDPHPTANRLRVFHGYFFDSLPMGSNTYRHVANPYSEGACKRMNMFLRWMVRTNSPVDFGLWANISPA